MIPSATTSSCMLPGCRQCAARMQAQACSKHTAGVRCHAASRKRVTVGTAKGRGAGQGKGHGTTINRAAPWLQKAVPEPASHHFQGPPSQFHQHQDQQLQLQRHKQLQEHQHLLQQLPFSWSSLPDCPQEILLQDSTQEIISEQAAIVQQKLYARGKHWVAAEVQQLAHNNRVHELHDWALLEYVLECQICEQQLQAAASKFPAGSKELEAAEQQYKDACAVLQVLEESYEACERLLPMYAYSMAQQERLRQRWRFTPPDVPQTSVIQSLSE